MRKTALAALLAPTLLLTGCLMENSLDMVVYFDNQTDQTLFLRIRDPEPALRDWYFRIGPSNVNPLPLLDRGECADRWVITAKDGTVAKDPGRICWHDTVTIP